MSHEKSSVLSALLIGMKYGGIAVLATAIFLPLPIIIGDFFGRIGTVGHYSGPFPVLWVCGFSIGTVIPYSLPLFLGVCILSIVMVVYSRIAFLPEIWGKLTGIVLGLFAVLGGTILFEKYGLLEAFGGWIFILIMVIWGMILFGWIGHRMQKKLTQSAEHIRFHKIKDDLS